MLVGKLLCKLGFHNWWYMAIPKREVRIIFHKEYNYIIIESLIIEGSAWEPPYKFGLFPYYDRKLFILEPTPNFHNDCRDRFCISCEGSEHYWDHNGWTFPLPHLTGM